MAAEDTGSSVVLFVALSLLIGVCCRLLAQNLPIKLPYTTLLMVAGMIWGVLDSEAPSELSPASEAVERIDPKLFLHIFLPALIFESAFALRWHVFRRLLAQMLVLACIGVIIATCLTAVAVHLLEPSWDWNYAFLLASVLSATDPVAVVSLLKDLGASVQLRTLIEGESLLNDGTAIVLFTLFLDLTNGESYDAGDITVLLFRLSLGGFALGLGWSIFTIWMVGYIIDNAVVEITLTVASTYLLFLVAEDFAEVSGVLAIVTLGACFVYYGKARITPEVSHSLHEFWNMLSYFGNTLVFIIAGALIVERIGFESFTTQEYANLFIIYLLLFVIRALMVALVSPLLRHLGYGFGFRRAAVLIHGGLRGAVSIALSLIVELQNNIDERENPTDPELAERVHIRQLILFYGCGVTLLTLLINATTVGALVRCLGLDRRDAEQETHFTASVKKAKELVAGRLRTLVQKGTMTSANWVEVASYAALDGALEPESSICSKPSCCSSRRAAPRQEDDAMQLEGLSPAVSDEIMYASNYTVNDGASEGDIEGFAALDGLRQARLRFLCGTIELYNDMVLRGVLDSMAFKALVAAAESAQDHCDLPLNEWHDTLYGICRNPRWLSYLSMSNYVQSLWPLNMLVEKMIETQLALGVKVAQAYIDVHRQMCGSISGSSRVILTLRHESEVNRHAARAFLLKMSHKHGNIVSKVASQQAASIALKESRKAVGQLAARGLLLEAEVDALADFIRRKQIDLARHDHAFHYPHPAQALVYSRLFDGVSSSFRQLLFRLLVQSGQAILRTSHDTDYLLSGTVAPSAALVLSGSLSYQAEAPASNAPAVARQAGHSASQDRVVFVLPGSFVGMYSTLSKQAQPVHLKACHAWNLVKISGHESEQEDADDARLAGSRMSFTLLGGSRRRTASDATSTPAQETHLDEAACTSVSISSQWIDTAFKTIASSRAASQRRGRGASSSSTTSAPSMARENGSSSVFASPGVQRLLAENALASQAFVQNWARLAAFEYIVSTSWTGFLQSSSASLRHLVPSEVSSASPQGQVPRTSSPAHRHKYSSVQLWTVLDAAQIHVEGDDNGLVQVPDIGLLLRGSVETLGAEGETLAQPQNKTQRQQRQDSGSYELLSAAATLQQGTYSIPAESLHPVVAVLFQPVRDHPR